MGTGPGCRDCLRERPAPAGQAQLGLNPRGRTLCLSLFLTCPVPVWLRAGAGSACALLTPAPPTPMSCPCRYSERRRHICRHQGREQRRHTRPACRCSWRFDAHGEVLSLSCFQPVFQHGSWASLDCAPSKMVGRPSCACVPFLGSSARYCSKGWPTDWLTWLHLCGHWHAHTLVAVRRIAPAHVPSLQGIGSAPPHCACPSTTNRPIPPNTRCSRPSACVSMALISLPRLISQVRLRGWPGCCSLSMHGPAGWLASHPAVAQCHTRLAGGPYGCHIAAPPRCP